MKYARRRRSYCHQQLQIVIHEGIIMTYEDPEKAATEPTEAMRATAENFMIAVLS
jgi:hypothetical protein